MLFAYFITSVRVEFYNCLFACFGLLNKEI